MTRCTILTQEELRRLRRDSRGRIAVVARWQGGFVLRRDKQNALWALPQTQKRRGEEDEEAARRALGEAVGEAVFEIAPLCAFSVTGEDGKESGGRAFLADVTEWPERENAEARAFVQLPLGSQTQEAALAFALRRWAGEFFDERLELSRLGEIESL